MPRKSFSRSGLVLCVAAGLATSGCAAGSGWNRLIGRDGPSNHVSLAYANLKEQEGKLTEARDWYEKVLKQEPRNAQATLGMARLNVKAQRLVEAEQGFARALELNPKSAVVLSEVGEFYATQQRWDKAIPLFQEAQRIEPHEKGHHYNLATALTRAGRPAEAFPHFKEAEGEAKANFTIGQLLMGAGKTDEAMAYFIKAGGEAKGHYNVGRMLVDAGKTDEAEEHFALALAKDPSLSDAEYFLNEIRGGRSGAVEPLPAVAKTQITPTQQVSAVQDNSQPQVTPGRPAPRQVRPPLYPHGGYEELPPPGAGPTQTAGLTPPGGPIEIPEITPVSGFTAATDNPFEDNAPTPISPPPAANTGAQLRVSTQQSVPFGR